MAHEFVGIAQAFGIEYVVVIDNDGVGQIAAQTQIMRPHHFHFLHETEGAGTGDFVHIRLAGKVDFESRRAAIEYGMVEFDGQRYLKAVVRSEFHPFAVGLYFYRFDDFQETLLRLLIDNAGILQKVEERQAGAVHNRNFRRTELD